MSHRDERRRRFVDAALRVLDADGPELPMDAVAAEAGVSKPVLYRYFSDKAALVDALGAKTLPAQPSGRERRVAHQCTPDGPPAGRA